MIEIMKRVEEQDVNIHPVGNMGLKVPKYVRHPRRHQEKQSLPSQTVTAWSSVLLSLHHSVSTHELAETMQVSFSPSNLPKFKDLPLGESDPPHSAWGLWGSQDQLGCLNHLTAETIVAAAGEIRCGRSVGLSWDLNQMRIPPPYRIPLQHKIFSLTETINVGSREGLNPLSSLCC